MYKSRHFTEEETGCHCGKCDGLQGMPDELLRRADILRDLCGFPLTMTSGYRCPLHHQNPTGPHGIGAFDVSVSHEQAYIVLDWAFRMKFRGIGINQKGNKRFIHLDDCDNAPDRPRPHVWSY